MACIEVLYVGVLSDIPSNVPLQKQDKYPEGG